MGTGPVRALGADPAPGADAPPGEGGLRSLGAPRPVQIACGPSGIPHAVVAAGRRRLVVAVRDEWLVQDRWWTDHPVDRHYFEMIVEPGRPMIAFREADGRWFTHGHDPRAPGAGPRP